MQTDVYTYPATSNKLSAISLGAGGSRAFTYDAAGNVTYDNRAAGGYGYTYNAAGRMSEFTISGVLKASYKYDFAGRQAIRVLAGGITIHSVFDSAGNKIAEYNEATGALIREYVWMGGAPLAVIEGGVTTFIRADHIGRPVFGTNTAGTKVWTASYLPSGGVRTTTGTPVTAGVPGQWFQSESGLHQNWMRDYDPTTGRYLQADPLGLVDGASVYGYVKGNPGRWSDPKGLFTLSDATGSLSDRGVAGEGPFGTYKGKQLFDEWLNLEQSNTGWVAEIPKCPCSLDDLDSATWGAPTPANQSFHPGGAWETRSKKTQGGHGGQCIYGADRQLVTSIPAAGSADYRRPDGAS